MNEENQFQQLREQLFLEIGKCVLIFQQIEGALKRLLPVGAVEGFARDWNEIVEDRAKDVEPDTLGVLVGAFKNAMLSPLTEAAEPKNLDRGVYVSFRLVVSEDETFLASKKKTLTKLVKDRNDLVHHFYSRLQWDSEASLLSALADVSALRERAVVEKGFFIELLKQLDESTAFQKQLLASGFWETHVEPFLLRESGLLNRLKEYATNYARPDGWSVLASAGNYVKKHAPSELENKFERFGYSQLHKIVEASQLFDLMEERIETGPRWLYRLKPAPQSSDVE